MFINLDVILILITLITAIIAMAVCAQIEKKEKFKIIMTLIANAQVE